MSRDLIQIFRGNEADLPDLAQGEPAFTLDGEKLYIGGLNGNVDLSKNITNLKTFGAVGDGVTDDTLSFLNAVEYCLLNDIVLEMPAGVYLIKYSSIPAEKITTNYFGNVISICSMIGYKANLILDGNFGFDTSSVDELIISNIILTIKNYNTSASLATDGSYIFSNDTANLLRIYRDITIRGDVSLTDGTQRIRAGITEKVLNGSIFDNINIENCALALRVRDSANFNITNCNMVNVETAIWIEDCLRYCVQNVTLDNTYTQSQNWIQKTHPTTPDTDFNGKDLILCDGEDYVLTNLNAINPIERCVYSLGGDVKASNLKCINGDGFKFVGHDYNDISKNIKVSDTLLIVDRDISGSEQTSVGHSQIYYVENCHYSNCKIIDLSPSQNAFQKLFSISRTAKNIYLENIDADFCNTALVYVVMRSESGLTADEYNVLDNLVLKNSIVRKNLRTTGSLLYVRTNEASADALNNYVMSNIRLYNNEIIYSDSADADTWWYDWAYVNGLRAENNKANKRAYATSGLPSSVRPQCSNIVVKEKNIIASNATVVLAGLQTFNLSKHSSLHIKSETDSINRIGDIYVTVYDVSTEYETVIPYDHSDIKAVFYCNEAYYSIENMPDNYIVKISSTDGYYIGVVNGTVLTDIVSTAPFTIALGANIITFRGDLYLNKKATITIECNPL